MKLFCFYFPRDLSGHPNKLLCFTRTSPLISSLIPSKFQRNTQTVFLNSTENVKNIVYEDTEQLVLLKLSSVVTLTVVQQFIKEFMQSDIEKICVMFVNMQESSIRIVNHLRIMIEETESEAKYQKKLFVVVLHFPPSQIFNPLYPSVFLKGWDHWYLDTIAHKVIDGVIDIRDWFLKCCTDRYSKPDFEKDSLLGVLTKIIPHAVPIISSRVFIGVQDSKSMSSPINRLKLTMNKLNELLFDKGASTVLCERFCSYWNPALMLECLDRAAYFMTHRESSLNMTDSIQIKFKTLFFDFLVYMMHQINYQFNLNVILESNGNKTIQNLFLDILEVFPLPPLQQLGILSANLQVPQNLTRLPCFPFFALVNSLMDNLVEQCLEETNISMDILASCTSDIESIWKNTQYYDKNLRMIKLDEAVTNRIRIQMKVRTI